MIHSQLHERDREKENPTAGGAIFAGHFIMKCPEINKKGKVYN